MRVTVFTCLVGLGMALGFGLLVTLGDPFEVGQVDVAGLLFRAWVSTLHDLRPVVIDLVHHVLRGSP